MCYYADAFTAGQTNQVDGSMQTQMDFLDLSPI